jgi:DNA invertase Pin-like site-specific DNA recombinase
MATLVKQPAAIEEQGWCNSGVIVILNLYLDTATPTGKLMINLLGSIAAFEREIMLERQRDGIAAAKREGKYKGRAPTARRKAAEVIKLAADGHSISEIARHLGISRASAYRIKSNHPIMVA